MNTGLVIHAFDHLIGRDNYFGSHVNRAARIEPIVAPGAIYVSAELAFILAAAGLRDFATDYLGNGRHRAEFDTEQAIAGYWRQADLRRAPERRREWDARLLSNLD